MHARPQPPNHPLLNPELQDNMNDMEIQKDEGFTLIEIITVLIIIGVISAVVVNRLMDTSVELKTQTDLVKTHLRYAQARAMSSNIIWGIDFKTNSYSFFKNGDTTDMVLLPGEENLTLSLPSGRSATEIVSFDSWGRPYNNAAATSGHPGGQIGNLAISITKNTGFIQ